MAVASNTRSGASGAALSTKSRLAGLSTRIAAAAFFGPCVVVLAWRGGVYFVLLVNLLAVVGTFEFLRLVRAKELQPFPTLSYAAALGLPWLFYWGGGSQVSLAFTSLMALFAAASVRRARIDNSLGAAAMGLLGTIYVTGLFGHLILLRQTGAAAGGVGFRLVLLVFALMWVSDTGAYLVGSLWGRHPLAPRISPAKSLEGALGATVLSALAGALGAHWLLQDLLSVGTGAFLGAGASIAGQVGDLFESMLKRDAGIKDSSNAIPGHGGVLDRFDGVLFVAPLLYYVLPYVVS